MKQPPRQRPVLDERDQQIKIHSQSHALSFTASAAQILTILCLLKGNLAWLGSLSLLFFACAAEFYYMHKQYEETLYLGVSIVMGLIGVALLLWFVFMG